MGLTNTGARFSISTIGAPQVANDFDKFEMNATQKYPLGFKIEAANGDVYPFPYYYGCAEWMAGNVREYGLVDLWRSESFTRMRAVTRKHTGCSGCKKICQLWSRWFNYGRKKDICEPPINHPTCTSRE